MRPYFKFNEVEYIDYQFNIKNIMSTLYKLDWKDLLNGILTTFIGAIITYLYGIFAALYQLVIAGQPFQIQIDLQAMLVIGAFAGLSYLSKRFVSDTQGTVLGSQ